jgi:uncharacterized membrane protein
MFWVLTAVTSLIATTTSLQAGPVYLYQITDLGSLAGVSASIADGINGTGDVTGTLYIGSTENGFLYENGMTTNLGVLPGASFSIAYAINDSAHVVGYSGKRAFLYVFD